MTTIIPLTFLSTTNTTYQANVRSDTTVECVKEILGQLTGIPGDQLRLITAGKQMEDNKNILTYDITKNIYFMIKLGGPPQTKYIMSRLDVLDHTGQPHNLRPPTQVLSATQNNVLYYYCTPPPPVSIPAGPARIAFTLDVVDQKYYGIDWSDYTQWIHFLNQDGGIDFNPLITTTMWGKSDHATTMIQFDFMAQTAHTYHLIIGPIPAHIPNNHYRNTVDVSFTVT